MATSSVPEPEADGRVPPSGCSPTDDAGSAPLGRRERKKLETRRALHDAAITLVREHGLEVTVERICEVADVSPRTFFNYFSSKEEAIVGDAPKLPSDDLLAAFEAGGPSGDLLLDLRDVIARHLEASLPTLSEMHVRRSILDRHPELSARFMGSFMAIERRYVSAAATRLGTAVDDVRAVTLGSLATAVMRLSVKRWSHGSDERSLSVHVDEVVDALRDILG